VTYFYLFELSASKLTHALMATGFKSFMLFKVFGFDFLILASYSSETEGVLNM